VNLTHFFPVLRTHCKVRVLIPGVILPFSPFFESTEYEEVQLSCQQVWPTCSESDHFKDTALLSGSGNTISPSRRSVASQRRAGPAHKWTHLPYSILLKSIRSLSSQCVCRDVLASMPGQEKVCRWVLVLVDTVRGASFLIRSLPARLATPPSPPAPGPSSLPSAPVLGSQAQLHASYAIWLPPSPLAAAVGNFGVPHYDEVTNVARNKASTLTAPNLIP